MAYPTLSHGVVLMVQRFPARRIPAPFSNFRRIAITRNNNSPNSAAADEPRRRPALFSSAFYDGEVMIIDASPAEETVVPPTVVHGLSKEAISRFMKTTVYEAAAADPELCVVCQEIYRENQRVGVLRCRHSFHADCIGKWLQIKNVCPLCNVVGAV